MNGMIDFIDESCKTINRKGKGGSFIEAFWFIIGGVFCLFIVVVVMRGVLSAFNVNPFKQEKLYTKKRFNLRLFDYYALIAVVIITFCVIQLFNDLAWYHIIFISTIATAVVNGFDGEALEKLK